MEKIGIALSGGVARCIAHLGVLEVFLNAGIPIHAVAGTSGGSLVGALFVSGRFKIPELIEITRGLSWWKLTRP
ncbi:MAG TPA: patatin-like phospholipase family protein, partial [Nitrospiria bacterium]